MSLPGGTDDRGRFGIESLQDPDVQPVPRAAKVQQAAAGATAWRSDGRPVRRDLHWWFGGAMLAIALPMLVWQAMGQDAAGQSTTSSGQGRREGAPVRPPETIGALERTIEDQARLPQPPALPPLPPLPPGAAGTSGPRASIPHRPGASGAGEQRPHDLLAAAMPSGETQSLRAERLAAEQERRDADARSSPLLAIGQSGAAAVFATPRADRNWTEPMRNPVAGDAASAPGFATGTVSGSAAGVASSPVLRPPPGGPAVLEGTVIPAVLLTEINSELPGTLVALVTQDIWDSVHGRYLLIPKGSRLVGDYNSDVRPGQERVLAAFRRLIFPDGSSIDLLGTQATDAQGRSGLQDRVDRHFWTMFGASFIVAGIASLVQRQEAQPSTVIVVPGAASGASSGLASAAGSVLVETSRAILGRTRNIPPTVVIRQGHRFSLTVQRHFLLDPADAGRIRDGSR